MNIRTRFAPSPSGDLHLGNVRTALYAWLFAKQRKGKFILRIEDSNIKDHGLVYNKTIKNIMLIMKWLRLGWDEGPYFQTNRLSRYHNIIHDLLKNKMAYKCYCSEERLKSLRLIQIKYGKKPKYDGYCRTKYMSNYSNSNLIDREKMPYVVRFCNPLTGKVVFHDQIRGMISIDNSELDDVIIQRTSGMPTYNFCVVVDDMDMKITHIIRGEEHINNTPRQINILQALRAKIPQYAHVSMILDKNKKKISKRDSNGKWGIIKYRNDGFLPEAILNYLIRLGWSYRNQEIFSIDQMKKHFSLYKIGKSASIFDFKKLLWYNNHYMNHLPMNSVQEYFLQYIREQNISFSTEINLSYIIKLFSRRSNTLGDIVSNYFNLTKNFNFLENKQSKQYLVPIILNPLKLLKNKLSVVNDWTIENIGSVIKETVCELGIDMRMIGMPLRIALTGTDKSLELSTLSYIIGKYKVLYRLDQAIDFIKNLPSSD